MRRSEFLRAVEVEFGPRAQTVLRDLVLDAVGGRSASEALEAGVPPRDIWLAVCAETDVPENRRYGAGRLEPRRR